MEESVSDQCHDQFAVMNQQGRGPDRAWLTGPELAVIALGIAAGHLGTPPQVRWLGTILGAVAGVLLGRFWRRRAEHQGSDVDGQTRRGVALTHAIYYVLIGLSASMLLGTVATLVRRPERWRIGIAGTLFFGAALIILIVSWRREVQPASGRAPGRYEALIFGTCGIAFSLASGILILTGSPVIGFVGFILFGGAGLRALLKQFLRSKRR